MGSDISGKCNSDDGTEVSVVDVTACVDDVFWGVKGSEASGAAGDSGSDDGLDEQISVKDVTDCLDDIILVSRPLPYPGTPAPTLSTAFPLAALSRLFGAMCL